MNIISAVKDSLVYPFTDIKRFIILVILFSGIIFLFPVIYAFGYAIKIIKTSIDGSDTLPSFLGSEGMFTDGLRFIGTMLIYNIPYFLILLLFIHSIKQLNILTASMPYLALIIVNFIMSILFVIGVANMAYKGSFKSAFEFRTLFKLIVTIGWKTYIIILMILIIAQELLWLVINSLIYPLSNIVGGERTVTGFIIIFLMYGLFYGYTMIFVNRLRGLIYPTNIS